MKSIQERDFNKKIPEKIDLFICSSSFEERCFSVAKAVDKDRIDSSLVFYNYDQKDSITENAIKLNELLPNSKLVKLRSDDPAYSLKQTVTNLNIDNVSCILFDTTTFTHEGLLIVFKVLLLNKKPRTKILLAYNGAEEYSTNVVQSEDKWLTKGVGNVRTIMGYSGFTNPSLKTHLIILFGFEIERTLQVIKTFESDAVSIGISDNAYSIKAVHYEINKARHEQLIRNYPSINNFKISLVNPEETAKQIIEESDKYKNYNIIIAPMNNKFSTIGAALAAIQNDNIQLCYVPANIYNRDGYSLPSKQFYLYDLK